MKRLFVSAVLAASFICAPLAHADTRYIPIGDPYTDTIGLWSEIASALSSLSNDFASLFNGQEFAVSRPATPPAALAAAAANAEPATQETVTYAVQAGDTLSGIAQTFAVPLSNILAANDLSQDAVLHPGETLIIPDQQIAPETSSELVSNTTSDQTTLSQDVKSANTEPSGSQNIVASAPTAPAFNASNFVTQSELAQVLLALSTSPSTESAPTTTPTIPLADGNAIVPYAAENNITNLSGVTITNANLSASEIPALDYLSLSGGSLTGNLSVAGDATTTGTSYFTGNVGIGTSTSQDALAVNGSEYLPDITAPSLTTNRLYANGGSLYWAGNVIAGGATGNWTSDGTNVWRSGGDIGVGTTSPFATVSVVGTGYFTGALTAAAINATNGTTSNATSTSLFSTFGNFTTGLINTLSGTTLNYTAASTTNFSNYGTASFGGTATTTINSNGDLTVAGNTTLANATSSNFFATTASTTNLFADSASLASLSGSAFSSLTGNYLPKWNSGSWKNSLLYDNGTNVGIGTTSPSATFAVSGSTYTTGTTTAGSLDLTKNLAMSGTWSGVSDPSNSILYWRGNVSGTCNNGGSGCWAFSIITNNLGVTNTSAASGLFDVSGNVGGAGQTGGGVLFTNISMDFTSPSGNVSSTDYQALNLNAAATSGDNGTSGAYSGGLWAAGVYCRLANGATFWNSITCQENDLSIEGNASANFAHGIDVVLLSANKNAATLENNGFSVAAQPGATSTMTLAFAVGDYNGYSPLAASSTIIGCSPHAGSGTCRDAFGNSTIKNGVDFSTFSFTGSAFKSNGFNVDGSGNVTAANYFSSSTNALTAAGIGALSNYFDTTSTDGETAVGYDALLNATSSNSDTAVGYQALKGSSSISNTGANSAFGWDALTSNTSGHSDDAFGTSALAHNTTGNQDDGFGNNALNANTTGGNNSAFGHFALANNTTGAGNVAVGTAALQQTQTGGNNTAVGNNAGEGVSSNSFSNNSLFGANAGFALSTGGNNVFLGFQAASSTVTGANNIALGYQIALPNLNGSNQLDIGNLIFGTGINGTYTTVSTGNIGIGAAAPYSRLQVTGPDAASSTSAFAVVNSASTTVFSVFDGGNAELSGSLSQSSDQRLKTNIQSLDASSSLSFIDQLNPVTFNWIDPNQTTALQLGFIAQQVQQIFPNLVSTTSATALTPGGTLSLNYIGLISPIVSAVQALSAEIASIENTIAGFAQRITTQEADVQKLCVGSTCVTPSQFQAMVAAASASQSSGQGSVEASPDDAEATGTPPVIQIDGDNPAIVQVGDTYNDLGATITGPRQDLNLGIQTFVNGVATSPVQIDTSATATDTIDYVAADQNGLASTSTRTVIIEAPSIVPSDNASPTIATTTDATSTAQ